jgi:hypothetical protein
MDASNPVVKLGLPADGYGAMVRRGISNGQRRTDASG